MFALRRVGSKALAGVSNQVARAAAEAPLARAIVSSAPKNVGQVSDNTLDWWKPLRLDQNGGLEEYSVVYTSRALNHMSPKFVKVMNDMNKYFCETYNARTAVILPGSGSYAMEAVARQLVSGKKAVVLRNGYFSYRWSDIQEQCHGIASSMTVINGVKTDDSAQPQFMPAPIDEVVATIKKEKPAVVFAPHVETSTGIMLPDDYIKQVSAAAHEVGGLFVLDSIASGTLWCDMKETGVDVIITAPQKGWTGPACAGIAVLSDKAYDAVKSTTSTSMVLNLRKWLECMEAYDKGGFMYYATMPTDALVIARDVMKETIDFGLKESKEGFIELGKEIRAMMASKGYKFVAHPDYQAPGVAVAYTNDADIFHRFRANQTQIAAGVPFMINEPAGNKTFRIGLFGLDRLKDRKAQVDRLEEKLDKVIALHTAEMKAEEAAA